MSATWPCRCEAPTPHPNLPDGYCTCGGYHVTLSKARTFKPVPDKPITTLRRRAPSEETSDA